MGRMVQVWSSGIVCLMVGLAGSVLAEDCAGDWRVARLTSYSSYPAPGSEECIDYNGCTWAGQFYGLPDKQTPDWVAAHDIAAVHEDDWATLGMQWLELRQGGRRIVVQVLDLCADADCDGCCTRNLGGDGYLIDLESATAARFGSGDGLVEFRVCMGVSEG